jgi:hypothetical protein
VKPIVERAYKLDEAAEALPAVDDMAIRFEGDPLKSADQRRRAAIIIITTDFLKAPQAALALNVVVRSLLRYCARVARER